MATDHYPNNQGGPLAPALVAGFAGAVGALIAWFASHLPMLHLSEQAARPCIIACWAATLLVAVWWTRSRQALAVGLGAGLSSAAIGALLIGGTRTRAEVASHAPAAAEHAISPAAVIGGFLLIGIVLGLLAGALVRAVPPGPTLTNRPRSWLARFALVTACAVAPLLFIGGLVTSTNSGMAVPDWPTTFGSNMLAYPIGQLTPEDVFLEHSHRLFGMLVGLATLTLLVWVLLARVSGWPRIATVIAFLLVCGQGILGGYRVRHDSRPLAMLHGVLAQLVFGLIVAIAAYLTPSFTSAPSPTAIDRRHARRLKAFATGLLHALVLQLLLGAVTRHFRATNHPLWTHAALSVVVVILATMTGFSATSLPRSATGGVAALRRCGSVLVAVAAIQFLLGWGAFLVRGKEIKAASTLEALIRTSHQANGGLLIALAACTFVWARWLWRGVRITTESDLPANIAFPAQSGPRAA